MPPAPSLFTLALEAPALTALAGVVMEPVGLELQLPAAAGSAPQRFRQSGTVLITHWGLSGPACLRLTAFAARALQQAGYRGTLTVDWSGGRSAGELEELFAELRRSQARRQLRTARPWPELSRRLWWALLEGVGLQPDTAGPISRQGPAGVGGGLAGQPVPIRGRGPFGRSSSPPVGWPWGR